MRKLTLALISAFALVSLAACGDDDNGGGGGGDLTAEEQEFVDAAMAEFDAEEAEPLNEDEARCMVTSMVQAVGVDTLEEAGMTAESFGDDAESSMPEGLSEDQAEAVVDGMDGCFNLADLFLEGMAEDDSLSDEDKECLEEAFDDDTVKSLFVAMLTQGEEGLQEDPEIMSTILSAFAECPGAMGG